MDTPHPGRVDEQGQTGLDEALLLDSQICFSLNAASRAFAALYRVVLKDLGLTYPQYLVMLVLWEDGTTPVKHLGERLRLDSGTLSPLLKRLEAAGLVHRRRSAADERSVHIHLTAEGLALREQACHVPRRIAAATGFDRQDARTLRLLLTRLTGALDDAAGQDAAPPAPAGPAGRGGTAEER
ncbi:MarR family winged helix-turn-helix transcriptional regulator [Streptomyces sp. UH6]|uniref:MarR family winged helix-turn-helix transcriptional regulator n=1 Tax=Streptomyces sp. UH6 TaxID=2748379 RepID=UPI0015D4F178|nr:MarR family transcriptional regulator [Streptomyces sp. UH6]NYV74130.1 MarR family transcriptional regulator [Streptomyces sp. UH6]